MVFTFQVSSVFCARMAGSLIGAGGALSMTAGRKNSAIPFIHLFLGHSSDLEDSRPIL